MSKAFRSLTMTLVVPLALLAGCGDGRDFADLQTRMAEIKAQPRGHIEPPPDFTPIATVSYSAHQKRSPFSPPMDADDLVMPEGRQVEPDFTRPKEYLERFTLDSLKMKGSMSRADGPLFALILDPTGATNRVKVGDHLGKNFGRVVEVTDASVSVMEIVPDGKDGWVERPRVLKLDE